MIDALKKLMGMVPVSFSVPVSAEVYRAVAEATPPTEEWLEVDLDGLSGSADRFPEDAGWELVSYDRGIARIPWNKRPSRVRDGEGLYVCGEGEHASRMFASFSRIAVYVDGPHRFEVACSLD